MHGILHGGSPNLPGRPGCPSGRHCSLLWHPRPQARQGTALEAPPLSPSLPPTITTTTWLPSQGLLHALPCMDSLSLQPTSTCFPLGFLYTPPPLPPPSLNGMTLCLATPTSAFPPPSPSPLVSCALPHQDDCMSYVTHCHRHLRSAATQPLPVCSGSLRLRQES